MGTNSEEAGAAPAVDVKAFLELVRSRYSARNFRPDPVPAELMNDLLEAARWAPSGFNLQPTHYVVVTDPAVKQRLHPACMKQRQILEAGAVVVFTGDRRVVANQFEQILQQDRDAGAINEDYERLLRWSVPLFFHTGPIGLGWLWKAVAELVVGPFTPIPHVQAVHRDFWLAKQVCLSAMTFMLAAQSAGLATLPMEGFGERAVRAALGVPSSHTVVVVVALGYADSPPVRRTRLPLEGRLHRDRW